MGFVNIYVMIAYRVQVLTNLKVCASWLFWFALLKLSLRHCNVAFVYYV